MLFETKRTQNAKYAIGFSPIALKQVSQQELEKISFPCVLFHVGFADDWQNLWGLKNDKSSGWRQDYLKFAPFPAIVNKKAEKPEKQEEKKHMANQYSTNNRQLTHIYPLSFKISKALAQRPTLINYEDAQKTAKEKSLKFGKGVILEDFEGTNKYFTETYENGKMVERVQHKAPDSPQEKEEVVCRKTREKRFDKVLPKTKKQYVR